MAVGGLGAGKAQASSFLVFTVAFALSNKGNRIAWLKTGAVFLLLISCSAIFELIVNKFDGTRKIMDFYNMSSQYKTGGGLIGGLLCKAFCPALGLVGAYVILVVLALISVVLITERKMKAKMHTSTTKVYDSAKATVKNNTNGSRYATNPNSPKQKSLIASPANPPKPKLLIRMIIDAARTTHNRISSLNMVSFLAAGFLPLFEAAAFLVPV